MKFQTGQAHAVWSLGYPVFARSRALLSRFVAGEILVVCGSWAVAVLEYLLPSVFEFLASFLALGVEKEFLSQCQESNRKA